MNNKTLNWTLLSLTLLIALMSWFLEYRAITVSGSSVWFLPIIAFGFFFISLSLGIILIKDILLAEIVFFASFALSMFFAFSLTHALIVIISSLLLLSALRGVRKDMDLNIKLDVVKSLHAGKGMMVFAIVIMITSQYYFTVNSNVGEKNIPKFEISSRAGQYVIAFLSKIDPRFKSLNGDENLTVDEYILKMQSDQVQAEQDVAIQGAKLTQQQIDAISKKMILDEGHKQLSELTGKEIFGNERMNEIFLNLINRKINSYLSPAISNGSGKSVFSIVLAVVLLLTIAPIASIVSFICIRITKVIFQLLVRTGCISIRKIPVEMEVIE